MSKLRDLLDAELYAEPPRSHTAQQLGGGDQPPQRGLYPGAVALLMRDGEVLDHVAVGDAVRYGAADDGAADKVVEVVELPPDERVPMSTDTVFDIASLSKLFTAVTTMTLVEEEVISLDAPVASKIPEWSEDQRGQITVRQLLTHTSGLPAIQRLWEVPSPSRRRAAIFETPLNRMPGSHHEYSCVGYIVLGLLLERVTGTRLARLVDEAILTPLRLSDTRYLPNRQLIERSAATEYQPYTGRNMVRGEVHDETSWSLGGTAGNAGLFSTATDLARFAEMLRRGGELGGERILRADSVELLTSNQLPATIDPGYGQGLGPRIGDRSFMGDLAAHGAFGHTGFTGTSLVVTPYLRTVTILLTNRVHPSREWSQISDIRRRVADLTLAV
ncbi:class A beta-lactamase-related serine hydrolase [Actinobacteria bacterium YIM 96077]|uniref:Serine hydrolase n=1 Tax=Phytoactinopolyspora halophila TaxID=1981511 RepID=A0A329QK12_9ACTN|nr:serine hydrolase domain-containing protein [Phytoactinopolyspora halophila]AYY13444.1 class A beta-lactamase-related serine hydrolase [Actinobacteria bacterium YIM 96077]RAW10838.1 serine hydrolase [Phytoactinopolyspora halophila]